LRNVVFSFIVSVHYVGCQYSSKCLLFCFAEERMLTGLEQQET